MTTLERTVTTTAAPEVVFPWLVDFRNATAWDSGTVTCERVSGDGGPGTVYRNVSRFMGNEVELEYTTDTVDRPRFVIVGRNDTTTSHDTVTVEPGPDGGSTVTYRAEFTFSGLAKIATPLLKPFLEKLGNDTAAQLKQALDRL